MRICILGAGSLGSAIGGTLVAGGAEVYLVDRCQTHVNVMNRDGLALYAGSEKNKPRFVKVKATTHCEDIGEVDLVGLVVKSFATQAAMECAKPIIGKDTMVLSLQNGLGNEDVIAKVVGRERLIGGRTYVGGQRLRPGHVIATTAEKMTRIGELDGRKSARIEAVKRVFDDAGMLIEVTDNIVGEMWDKLLVNVATGAISGLTKLTYGDMYAIPEIEATACAAVAEGIAVAAANGIRLSSTVPRDAWFKAAVGLPKGFKTSMLQSLEKKGPTEIDYINGAVVQYGKKIGIPTPVNSTLVACIKGLEKSM